MAVDLEREDRLGVTAASSGVSANWAPPAFIRPPVSTWDLITTGPPISSAISRAASEVVANPCLVTGIPALATIARDSYSKKRMDGAGRLAETGESHPELCRGRKSD